MIIIKIKQTDLDHFPNGYSIHRHERESTAWEHWRSLKARKNTATMFKKPKELSFFLIDGEEIQPSDL